MTGEGPRGEAPHRSGRRWSALLLAGALALGACNEPRLEQGDDPVGDEEPATGSAEPEQQELLAHLDQLAAAVDLARDELATATDTEDAATAETAVARALAALLEDPSTPTDPPALLPATTTDRGDAGGSDALTTTLTLARETGGELGSATVDVLRFPIAGDLGAWERDPAGMIASVEDAIGGAQTLDQREESVLRLPGDATRALAWTMAADRARTLGDRRLAAERAVAHLDIVAGALDELRADHPRDGGTA